MLYINNEYGQLFSITDEAWDLFDSYYIERAGCDIHLTKEAMFQQVATMTNHCDIDDFESKIIAIKLNDEGNLIEVNSSGIESQVFDDYPDDWLAAYKTQALDTQGS
ncbi:TPA: hypothetical protein I7730_16155 [Vibrio vulnificus]|uniref:Uncharacterized protein n=1 Tax=Vibrio vulnificus TaxID=672 RepID=A0A8H9N1V6_VIBVL|nr:hypothetical protein [Vibrio vulnificus]HAS8541317.1 hypothetical protein [Vibrio vulnificus]